MSLQYTVPVALTILGDGQSSTLAFDLAKDYCKVGEHLKQGWLIGKMPSSAMLQSSSSDCTVMLKKHTSIVFITFASPPTKGFPVNVNLYVAFEGEDYAEPSGNELTNDQFAGKQAIEVADLAGQ